jgi:phosphoribosylformylglycinamidine (FGAM) synthase-like enzyme
MQKLRLTLCGVQDFNAVQRGDAEMENKVNRVIRACVEHGADNPIVSIHDQGAGGNGNVLKELVDPAGAKIDIRYSTTLKHFLNLSLRYLPFAYP